MKKFVSGLVIAALFAAQPALAAKSPHLPQPVAPTLAVEMRLTQQEIGVAVPDNGAAAAYAVGGLLGALVGAAINNAAEKKAETRVVEVRNALIDYDFNTRIEAAMRQVDLSPLSPDAQLHVLTTSLAADIDAGQVEAAPFVLQVTPSYVVTNDFETMRVSMQVMLMSREINGRGKLKQKWQKYARNYTWTMKMPPSGESASADAGRMAALGTGRLSAMLDRGVQEVVDMFAYDLTDEARAEIDSVPKGRPPSHSLADVTLVGRKLRGDDMEMLVRTHRINNLEGVQLVDPEAPIVAAANVEAPAAESVGSGE